MALKSIGGNYSGIYTAEKINGVISYFIKYKDENNVSVRVKIGDSPEMNKTKAKNALVSKRQEIANLKKMMSGKAPSSILSKPSKNHIHTLNELADFYINEHGKKIRNLAGVISSYNYHVRNEAFAIKPIQMITREDIKDFVERKHKQRSNKRMFMKDKVSIEVRELEEYTENEVYIHKLRSSLIDTEEDLKWIVENRIKYIEKKNKVLRDRIDPIASAKIMNDNLISVSDKKTLLGVLSNKTVKDLISQCSSIINYANFEKQLNLNNPFVISKYDKVLSIKIDNIKDRFMTNEELKLFHKEIKRVSIADKKLQNIYLIFMLSISTASRQSTIMTIKISDIDFETGKISLRNHKSARTFSSQIGSEDIKNQIKLLVGDRDEDEYLFADSNGNRPVRFPRKIGEILNYTVNCNRPFLKWLSIKDFRNTAASHLAMNGLSMLQISKILDHSDIKITQRYTHLSPESIDQAIGDVLTSFAD